MITRLVRCIALLLIPSLLVVASPLGCSSRGPSDTVDRGIGAELLMTVVPYEAADKLADDYQPMVDYLAKSIGAKKGKFVSVVDYAGVLAALRTGQLDVAYLSPFPYSLASGQMKLNLLAMPWVKGSLTYRGILFARTDGPIKTIGDLAGKTFAFGDPSSTSGFLMPKGLLEKAGVLSKLKRSYSAGDANMVVQAVESGTADAGAAYESVFEVAYRASPEKAKGMRVLGYTESIPNGIYVARGNLPVEQVEALRKAFLAMNNDPEGKEALRRAPNDKVDPADDALFNPVREIAKSQGITITVFDKKK